MGPTVGGYLAEIYGWPTIFYINWVPGLLLLFGVWWGLDNTKSQLKMLAEADWLGIALMAMGLGSLTIMLEEGNSKDWFDSSFIITFATLAVTGIVGWAYTSFNNPKPFVNLRLYGQRNFLVATALSGVIGMSDKKPRCAVVFLRRNFMKLLSKPRPVLKNVHRGKFFARKIVHR